MVKTGSNNVKKKFELWSKQGRIMVNKVRIMVKAGSNNVKKKVRIMVKTGLNNGKNGSNNGQNWVGTGGKEGTALALLSPQTRRFNPVI